MSVTITDAAGTAACPPAAPSPALAPECKNALLTLTNGSVTLNPVNILLVKYN